MFGNRASWRGLEGWWLGLRWLEAGLSLFSLSLSPYTFICHSFCFHSSLFYVLSFILRISYLTFMAYSTFIFIFTLPFLHTALTFTFFSLSTLLSLFNFNTFSNLTIHFFCLSLLSHYWQACSCHVSLLPCTGGDLEESRTSCRSISLHFCGLWKLSSFVRFLFLHLGGRHQAGKRLSDGTAQIHEGGEVSRPRRRI